MAFLPEDRRSSGTGRRLFLLAAGGLLALGGAAAAIFGRGQDRIIGLVAIVFWGGGSAMALLLDRPSTGPGPPVMLGQVRIRNILGQGMLFPTPPRKFLVAMLGASIFVVVGVTFIAFAPRFGPTPLIASIGGITILFFGFVAVAGGIAYLRGQFGLFLLPQGFGRLGVVSYLVPWDAVATVTLRGVFFSLSPSVCIRVVSRGAIQASSLARRSMGLSRWLLGADDILPNSIVGVPVERLVPVLERYRLAPELRDEIGTPAGLSTVSRLLDEPYTPPSP